MQLEQIITLIKEPDKILAVQDMEKVIDYTTMFIYELEQDISGMDFQVDSKIAELAETNSIAKSEVLIKLDPVYIERKKKELTLKTLKSYRTNIRKKQSRLTNNY